MPFIEFPNGITSCAYAWQYCPKQSCVHSPGTSSLLIPASLAYANAWIAQLMSCAFAQCWCSNLPQDPQYPVFDLMCVPSVMQRKCKASKMAGAGLLQSTLHVSITIRAELQELSVAAPFQVSCLVTTESLVRVKNSKRKIYACVLVAR